MRKIIALVGVTALIILNLVGCTPEEDNQTIKVIKEVPKDVSMYIQEQGAGSDGNKTSEEMIDIYVFLNSKIKQYYKSLNYGVLVRDPLSEGDYKGYDKSQKFEVVEFKPNDIYNKMDFQISTIVGNLDEINSIDGTIGINVDIAKMKSNGFKFEETVFYDAIDNLGFIKIMDREKFNIEMKKYLEGQQETVDTITIYNGYYSETLKLDAEQGKLYWTYSFNRTIGEEQ